MIEKKRDVNFYILLEVYEYFILLIINAINKKNHNYF